VAVRIYTNLNPDSYIKNTELIHRFFKKEFTEFELAYFDAEKLFPSRYYELMEMYSDKSKFYVKQEPTNDGAHFCGKCKTYKTTYYQLQTRSAKIIGWKSALLITSWLCYWKNSCSPSLILKC
jgi:DNA-directed RNA polymerase subunit M/transcription elongation factor TFIIS